MDWRSGSAEETRALGKGLAAVLRPGDVLALIGDLGAGKTTFVQGVASGLGASERAITSPSFVLVRECGRGRIPLFHADLFRLDNPAGAATVGLEEYYDAGGVTVIEWADRIPGILPDQFLEIRFEALDPETRRMTVIPRGENYRRRFEAGSGFGSELP